MTTAFTPVSLERRDDYYTRWALTPVHSLDYTLANLWGWQEYYGLEWCFDTDLCWLRQTRPLPVFWAPLGDWQAVDWGALDRTAWRAMLAGTGIDAGNKLIFLRVPEELAKLWQRVLPLGLDVVEDRGQWEYLYKQEELALLPGNRFHKKKNHYNRYKKKYGEDYHNLDNDMIEEVLILQDNWCQLHECHDSPSLVAENKSINRVLSHWNFFKGLCGGSLHADGKMVAFSVGERLGEQTLGVHYEKGLNCFMGVYQAINGLFAQHAGAECVLVNRAQDMNEEGLRQAKLSYLPTDFLRKYKVGIRLD
ncbi:MAG: phosphatidylglycerol lysyltransferase domain-containing protein [Desulfovibrio sp.]|jgi:hypothetical protein|nr:phosphatidylglycerol lysyltransferase domain-containing protein [Desulfovibrio sp.]